MTLNPIPTGLSQVITVYGLIQPMAGRIGLPVKSSLYVLPKFSRVPSTIVLIPLISTIVNGILLNLRVIFDQWPKLHLGLDVLSNQKILNGIYYLGTY